MWLAVRIAHRVDELAAACGLALPGRPVKGCLIVFRERCHCCTRIHEPLQAHRVAVLGDEMHRSVTTLQQEAVCQGTASEGFEKTLTPWVAVLRYNCSSLCNSVFLPAFEHFQSGRKIKSTGEMAHVGRVATVKVSAGARGSQASLNIPMLGSVQQTTAWRQCDHRHRVGRGNASDASRRNGTRSRPDRPQRRPTSRIESR